MNLNATLLGEMITFALFAWFTMRFVWPHIIKAMQSREQTIANGLAAAEKGVHELEVAQHKVAELLQEARLQAADVIEKANHRAGDMIETAKGQARLEGQRLMALAQGDIEQAREQARHALQTEVANIAMAVVAKFLGESVDVAKQRAVFDAFVSDMKQQREEQA